jgi:hypothetical protein
MFLIYIQRYLYVWVSKLPIFDWVSSMGNGGVGRVPGSGVVAAVALFRIRLISAVCEPSYRHRIVCTAIFCYEISRLGEISRSRRTYLLNAAVILLPFIVIVPLIMSTLATYDLSGTQFSDLNTKWRGLYYIFRNSHVTFDASFFGFLALFFGFLLFRKWIDIPGLGWLFLLFAGLVYLIVPEWVFNVWGIDTRLPVAFVFFAIAIVRWRVDTPIRAVIFNSIIVLALALRALGVTHTWLVYGEIASDYEKSFGRIKPGSRILVTRDNAVDWRKSGDGMRLGMDQVILWHLPVLAVIERSSLVSTVFAHSGNPLTIKSPYRKAIPIDKKSVLTLRDLDASPSGTSPSRGYVRNWRECYDYLYIQYAVSGDRPNLAGVKLVYQGSSFQLYKIAASN